MGIYIKGMTLDKFREYMDIAGAWVKEEHIVEVKEPHGRLKDADALMDTMYHEAFENDASYDERNPMARWDSGLWIRYKLFENSLEAVPTVIETEGAR